MNILAILGSPRRGGNCEKLLDQAIKSQKSQVKSHKLKVTSCKKIILNELNFRPCQACEEINQDGTCKIQDDFKIIEKAVFEADIIILASPIYFGSISAQTKMMIDRFQCLWRAKEKGQVVPPLYHIIMLRDPVCGTRAKGQKKGFFICVQAGNRTDFFDNARAIVKNFFATIGASYEKELLVPNRE